MTLAQEAERYLAVVDFFRAQGCEPQWRPEAVRVSVEAQLETVSCTDGAGNTSSAFAEPVLPHEDD